jgi:hypothetical protein
MKTTVLLLGIALAGTPTWAQMYKWVDKNGKTHYTDSPPPDDAKRLSPPKSSSGAPTSPSAPESQAGTKVLEHANVGVRLNIPASWEPRDRDREIFVNCAPRIESRPGMPGCYFTMQKHRLPEWQASITDTDRAKWKGWATADGMRLFVSANDVRVAGYPAHEILVREGRERNAALSMRLFVLIPGAQVVDTMHYAYWDEGDQSGATRPAVRSALETLKPLK